MDVYEAMAARHTIRDFDPRPVGRDTLLRILEAGVAAPSNDHTKGWDFVLVEAPDRRIELLSGIKKEIGRAEVDAFLAGWAMEDSQRAMYFDGVPKQYRMLLTAPVLLVPTFVSPGELLAPESLSALNPFASAWCCIENILVAAAAEGIMGVTRIPFEEERPLVKRVLGLPRGVEFACYLALGYPEAGARIHEVPPRSVAERLRVDHWKRGKRWTGMSSRPSPAT
jgi:nitroreductase